MKRVLVFLIVGFVFFGSCSAQNANAQSANDAQRIVGTWRGIVDSSDGESRVFTFNSNGTFTCLNTYSNETISGIYFIGGSNATGLSNLFLKLNNATARNYALAVFSISPNGRILVLSGVSNVAFGNDSLWLDKQ